MSGIVSDCLAVSTIQTSSWYSSAVARDSSSARAFCLSLATPRALSRSMAARANMPSSFSWLSTKYESQ
ncbi:hypothetical protein KC325_g170 [Hortaea werneckii]|nr:hypothetical protein KC325_g170 [Hortaea werneckii]